jgi:hypothetical protein
MPETPHLQSCLDLSVACRNGAFIPALVVSLEVGHGAQ